LDHVPDDVHVWTSSPEHCIAPGEQLAAHAPPEQTAGQSWVLCQVPVESQVST
jgi:hypothetical protein